MVVKVLPFRSAELTTNPVQNREVVQTDLQLRWLRHHATSIVFLLLIGGSGATRFSELLCAARLVRLFTSLKTFALEMTCV